MIDKLRKAKVPVAHKDALRMISHCSETWMPHPVYSDFYASSLGRVASVVKFKTVGVRVKLLRINSKVELTRGTRGKSYQRKQYLPHRFVWECFYGVIDLKQDTRQIVFRNGDPGNIALANLEMVRPADRIKRQIEKSK